MGPVDSVFRRGTLPSIEERLRTALAAGTDVERRRKLTSILGRLREVFASSGAVEAEPALLVEETPLEARLTLVPGSKGKGIDPARVLRELGRRGIRENIAREAIQAACEAVARKELVHSLMIARGVAPENGEDSSVEFHVRAFDKRVLLDPQTPFLGDLAAQIETVEAGGRVATLNPPAPGRPGVDIHGRPLPCAPGAPLPLRPGAGIRTASNGRDLHAAVSGTLVAGDGVLEVVPFRVFEGGIPSEAQVDFRGHILVTGHAIGPATLRGRDIYVEGNVEGARVSASGDLLVGGALQGKSRVWTEGLVLARQISDATVEALGDVLVRNSIVEGRVTSSGFVRVLGNPGAIEGGSVSARKGIAAGAVGSDWGIETSISAGKDLLGAARLPDLEQGIAECEEELRNAGRLLPRQLAAGTDLAPLPPGEQEACAETLEKAARILWKLSGLRRTKESVGRSRGDVSRASIHVSGPLHPPVKVEIGPAVQLFRKRLDRVVLVLGHNRRIRVKESDAAAAPSPRPERKTRTRRRG